MDSQILRQRRTIRKYKDKDIPQSLLNSLLQTAAQASTTGNMQLYSVIVTRDAEKKKALAPAHFNQPMVTAAPVVLTFCADFNRFVKWCELRNAKPGYDNFQSFLTATLDAVIFTQQFCTAAELEGLGICYLGTTTYNPDMIIKALSLPKLVMPVTTITAGYPDDMPQQPDRLPSCAYIHEEQYNDYDDKAIDSLYAPKEALPENRGYVEENGKETLAQVFTDIRYTKQNNEIFSVKFLETLKSQGFDF